MTRSDPATRRLFIMLSCWGISMLSLFFLKQDNDHIKLISTQHSKSEIPSIHKSTDGDAIYKTKPLVVNNKNIGYYDNNYSEQHKIMYHEAKTDRSGAVIHDMLLAHAYAYRQNMTYGGSCPSTTLKHLRSHIVMVDTLGLSHVLKFQCPDNTTHHQSIDRVQYTRSGTRLWTNEWIHYIRSQQQQQQQQNHYSDNKNTITKKTTMVVHIRRGDVALCDPNTQDRYIPNQHYINLIEKYCDSSCAVIIFSETQSTESWDDFLIKDYNITLKLDGNPSDAWIAMMDADIVVLSKSSFSVIPVIFNRNKVQKVIYTPFWVQPLQNWIIIDDDMNREMLRMQLRLKHQICQE